MPIFADILTTLPSQCVSALSSGQILTYQSPVGTSWTPAIITLSQTSVAWGMQVKVIQTADANGNFPMDPEDVVGAPSDLRAFWGGFAGVLVGVTGLIVSAVIFRRWLSRRKYREGRIVEDGGGQHVR
jgi:ribose/xylose/arabinose/galactoside ABC-type transport system permease subunit